jgi:hypothetical protein
MTVSIKPATVDDLTAMTDLLLADAEQRRAMNPALWPLAGDARARIEAAVRAGLAADASPKQVWLLAEAGGRAVGIAHGMIVPVPPIYNVATPPGLLLDDCYAAPDAMAGTADALLTAMEAALQEAGAFSLIASCPAAGPWRALYERQGYEAVTLYMAKGGLAERPAPEGVRLATAADVAGIVRLSADHRRTLFALNARFWPVHPDADSRFGAWMGYSLTLKDRDMFVAGAPGAVDGYVIAQPISPLHIPAGHDLRATGVIDDFYDGDFAGVAAVSGDGARALDLLAAAESAFARRGVKTALAVCPAAWTSKAALLELAGYGTAKMWMLKR